MASFVFRMNEEAQSLEMLCSYEHDNFVLVVSLFIVTRLGHTTWTCTTLCDFHNHVGSNASIFNIMSREDKFPFAPLFVLYIELHV
jgi:hypothetical protein